MVHCSLLKSQNMPLKEEKKKKRGKKRKRGSKRILRQKVKKLTFFKNFQAQTFFKNFQARTKSHTN